MGSELNRAEITAYSPFGVFGTSLRSNTEKGLFSLPTHLVRPSFCNVGPASLWPPQDLQGGGKFQHIALLASSLLALPHAERSIAVRPVIYYYSIGYPLIAYQINCFPITAYIFAYLHINYFENFTTNKYNH